MKADGATEIDIKREVQELKARKKVIFFLLLLTYPVKLMINYFMNLGKKFREHLFYCQLLILISMTG